MSDIDKIKAHLKKARGKIEKAMDFLDTREVGYSSSEIDEATEELMSAYAIAREYLED
jgi:hypothetical protein